MVLPITLTIADVQDVRTIGANQTTLLVPAYMGYVHALLNNPHHKQELSDMVRGLQICQQPALTPCCKLDPTQACTGVTCGRPAVYTGLAPVQHVCLVVHGCEM